jgi:hypothetical protein
MDKPPDDTVPGFKELPQHWKVFLLEDWAYHNPNGSNSRTLVRAFDNRILHHHY